ncbi:MAG: MotA/TolQ/ExbB proton channel family protein [Phycisphaerales bacterium]|nr:MotA/TolQ/ExbB proton channel family protein [Planctomycetota bacterium]
MMQDSLSCGLTLGATGGGGLWGLFVQSFDGFTVLLLVGSLVAVAIIVRCIIDVRQAKILPEASVSRINDLVKAGREEDLRAFIKNDESFPSRVLRQVLESGRKQDRVGMRETAEIAASEEVARWFRAIEPLNVVGNLGPLIGLAGTVWGMILAFTSLGESGGQAGPGDLSQGISKALFHTLLGLTLAIPCLFVFGFYRSIVDRICTRAMLVCSQLIEMLPATDDTPEMIESRLAEAKPVSRVAAQV